jgi:hypothetical protein
MTSSFLLKTTPTAELFDFSQAKRAAHKAALFLFGVLPDTKSVLSFVVVVLCIYGRFSLVLSGNSSFVKFSLVKSSFVKAQDVVSCNLDS